MEMKEEAKMSVLAWIIVVITIAHSLKLLMPGKWKIGKD